MKVEKNPWLPWRETIRLTPWPDRGAVLVIIPTAGKDPVRLKQCLDSLEMAARGTLIHPVVVLCPAELKTIRAVKAICEGKAEFVSLPGPFNYCHSINQGLSKRRPEDGYVLFLNDDVTFQRVGDLTRLKETLNAERWACVGPYIHQWHAAHSSIVRQAGAVRTNEPVNGCCVLWDAQWLDRLGQLDEAFGLGWGLDEADMCLRAVRRGARYGRNDAVQIKHAGHSTFGNEFTDYQGAAHQQNLRYFRSKYGADVGAWGQTHHWWPLPGIQVSIAAHNAAKWINKCLASVERALDGYRWILVIGDDRSSDKTYEEALSCVSGSSADRILLRRYQRKAVTVDEAKNRVLRLGMSLQRQYPVMCLMDADDEMGPERINFLLWQARDKAHRAVMGDFERINPNVPQSKKDIVQVNRNSQIHMGFGPWATLFHAGLVPKHGRLFRERRGMFSHGDVDLWVRWYARGIHIVPIQGQVVHRYYLHEGTASRPRDQVLARRMREKWVKDKARILRVPISEAGKVTYASLLPRRVRRGSLKKQIMCIKTYAQV